VIMATKHTHPVVFGRKVEGCPRCAELLAGAAPVSWGVSRQAAIDAERDERMRSHNCTTHGCGPVCVAFDW